MILPTMNDDERCFEAFRVLGPAYMMYCKLEPTIVSKFSKATKYPYILRFPFVDDKRNDWRLVCILPSKAAKKKLRYMTMCYTTFDVPPRRMEDDRNAGTGVIMFDPFIMWNEVYGKGGDRNPCFMEIVPHAFNRYTETYLTPQGLTDLDIHKKVENMLLRWWHYDVAPDLHGDKSAVKHKNDGICPYDVIMKGGGILRGQFTCPTLIRFFTYISKEKMYDNQEERYAEIAREAWQWRVKGIY